MNSEPGAGHDQEPVGQRHAGGDATGDRPQHEPGGDRGEVDHRLVLEPHRVREREGEVAGDDRGELAVVDRRGDGKRQHDEHAGDDARGAGLEVAGGDRAVALGGVQAVGLVVVGVVEEVDGAGREAEAHERDERS